MATEPTESPPERATRDLADPAIGSRPEPVPDSSVHGAPGVLAGGSMPEPLTTHAPEPHGTQSFAAPAATPANLYASRVLQARIKVNSTRYGASTPPPRAPRQTGPWSPQAVAGAAESKSNEVETEGAASVPAWPRSVNDTMEYQAMAAMARETAPVSFELKLPRVMLKQTIPVDLIDNKTRPVTAPPDMLMRVPPRPDEPKPKPPIDQRATQVQPFPTVIAPSAAPVVEDHRFEQAVALLLFVAAIYLVYLITA